MPTRYSGTLFGLLLAILAAGAMASLYISTPAGAGLANDSAAYIAGARSILQGRGYSDIWLDSTIEPITHYPPLLSLSLSALGLLGIDPLRGARLLNIFLFGANTLLTGWLGWRISRSQVIGLWAAAIFMLSPSLLRVHVFALSEPLYLFLSLLAFACADIFTTSDQKTAWLALAGLTSGLAFLTRYSALALLPVMVTAILIMKPEGFKVYTLRSRLYFTGVYLAVALAPMAAWFVRNRLAGGNATNRTFQYHPLGIENIQPGLFNVSQFLMPYEPWRQALMKSGLLEWALSAAGIGLLLLLAVRTLAMIFRPGSKQAGFLAYTTSLYVVGYLGAILFSMSFFDASTKFQPRILAPVFVCGIFLAASFITFSWEKTGSLHSGIIKRAGQVVIVLLITETLVISAIAANAAVTEFKTAGQGYASWKWHDSQIMASLKNLAPGTAIYTNTPPAVYLVTGKASRTLPTPVDPVDKLARGDYEENLAQMRADLLAGKAVLALFDTSDQEDVPGRQDMTGLTTGLKVLQKTQGDILYGKP